MRALGRVLLVIAPVAIVHAAYTFTGCASFLPPKTETYEERRERCMGESRADFYVGHKSPEEALLTFDRCMTGARDAG